MILEERPDLLEVLYQPFNLDWRGEEPQDEKPWYSCPMFKCAGGKVTSRITSRAYFNAVTRFGNELALTDIQREALDFVQDVANRPELRLPMHFAEGDMQFINNHAILHAREAYEDFDDPEMKRHLLRMWISLPQARRRQLRRSWPNATPSSKEATSRRRSPPDPRALHSISRLGQQDQPLQCSSSIRDAWPSAPSRCGSRWPKRASTSSR